MYEAAALRWDRRFKTVAEPAGPPPRNPAAGERKIKRCPLTLRSSPLRSSRVWSSP